VQTDPYISIFNVNHRCKVWTELDCVLLTCCPGNKNTASARHLVIILHLWLFCCCTVCLSVRVSFFFSCRHFRTFTQSCWNECVPLRATQTLMGFLLTLVWADEWHVNGFGLIMTKNCYFNASENNTWVFACMRILTMPSPNLWM